MIRPLARVLMLSVAALAACGGTAEGTAPRGHVSQFVAYRQYPVRPALDVVVVVSTSSTKGGAALRASVATALRTRMRQLAEGESWLHDVSNPLDVRAFVASAVDGSVRSADGVAVLGWRQQDATTEGAEAFATAVEDALRASPDGEVSATGVVETLERTLAVAASPEATERLVVLVSTSEDAGVSGPASAPSTRRVRDAFVAVVPGLGSAAECRPGPGLRAWAEANDAAVQTPCAGIDLQSVFVDDASDCLPRPLAPSEGGRSACRIRAFVPRGTACDAARGWRTLPESASRALDPSLADMDVCEVVELAGDDAAACRVASSAWAGRASGWCVPAPSRACRVAAPPRIVGAAAPPFARIEVACELSP